MKKAKYVLLSVIILSLCIGAVNADDKIIFEKNSSNITNETNLNHEKMVQITNSQSGDMYFTYSTIREAGYRVKNYIEANGKLPNYVSINTQVGVLNVPMPDFLWLMARSIQDQYQNSPNISVKAYFFNVNPMNPSGDSINAQITKSQYYTLASNTVQAIDVSSKSPVSVASPYGDIQYQTLIYTFSRIMYWMHVNNSPFNNAGLPNYVTINVPSTHSMNQYVPTAPSVNF